MAMKVYINLVISYFWVIVNFVINIIVLFNFFIIYYTTKTIVSINKNL